MAGEVASLLLSRMAVPVLYYMAKRHQTLAALDASRTSAQISGVIEQRATLVMEFVDGRNPG